MPIIRPQRIVKRAVMVTAGVVLSPDDQSVWASFPCARTMRS